MAKNGFCESNLCDASKMQQTSYTSYKPIAIYLRNVYSIYIVNLDNPTYLYLRECLFKCGSHTHVESVLWEK